MVTIRDPIHGDLQFSGVLDELIGCDEFQRLTEVKQLGLSYKVFPGATHTRFAHSVGVCYLAGEFAQRLGITGRDRELLQIAALLHDVGHYDFSHALEHLLDIRHEENGFEIIRGKISIPNKEQSIAKILHSHGFEPEEVISIIKENSSIPHHIISSRVIDVDRMDYLKRDTYFSGATIGEIDIAHLMRVLVIDEELEQLGVKEKGLASLEQFLVARLHMHQQVYQHSDTLIAELMLQKAVQLSLAIAKPILYGDGPLLERLSAQGTPQTKALVQRLRRGRSGIYACAYELRAQDEEFAKFAQMQKVAIEQELIKMCDLEDGDVVIYFNESWDRCDELPRFRVLMPDGSWENLFALSPLSKGVYEERTVKNAFAVYCAKENVERVRQAILDLCNN